MSGLESSPLLYLSMIGAMGITAMVLVKIRPALVTESGPTKTTYSSIAGLRGLLASSVFVHHAQVSRIFFRDGVWAPPQNPMYVFAGTGSVAIFFMITGFLFWGKAIDGRIQFRSLMLSRVRRILPLYMLGFLIIFVICIAESRFTISDSWWNLGRSTLMWLGGGLFGTPDINGVRTLTVNCGVTWTLQYEWVFYLMLPLLVVFSRPTRFGILIVAYCFILLALKEAGYRAQYQTLVVAIPFIGGMLSAYVVRHVRDAGFAKSLVVSCFVALSIGLGSLAYRPGYFTIVAISLFPAFAAMGLGNDIFGLLRLRWVVLLGEISFSIYLLHGIILLASMGLINRFRPLRTIPFYSYDLICVALSVVVVLVCTITYVLVERRFMNNGGRKARKTARFAVA